MKALRLYNRLLAPALVLLAIAAERAVCYWRGLERPLSGLDTGLVL